MTMTDWYIPIKKIKVYLNWVIAQKRNQNLEK